MEYSYFALFINQMSFVIVLGALPPDINFEGRFLTNNDTKVVQLIFSTNIGVQLCTVEFLIDKRTLDNIRYYDNNCYHTMRICSPTICACSEDCKLFTLNVTVTKDMMNHLYSCTSRIENEGVKYLTNITVIHDGNGGLKLYKKIVVPFKSVSSTQKVTSYPPELSTVSSPSAPLISVVAAIGLLSFMLLVIILFMICRKHWNSKTETRIEIKTISYPKMKSHTENAADGDRPNTFELKPEAVLDQFVFSEKHTQTGEARFSSFDPDICLEVQQKEHSKSDSRIRSIPNTRASQMRLEEDAECLEFRAEGQQFRLHPRYSYADSGISSISNTRSRQMQLDGETSFIFLENPYTRIPEAIDPRNIEDSTSYTTQLASRSSPPETMQLLDTESNRLILENPHSCNILNIQDSDA